MGATLEIILDTHEWNFGHPLFVVNKQSMSESLWECGDWGLRERVLNRWVNPIGKVQGSGPVAGMEKNHIKPERVEAVRR